MNTTTLRQIIKEAIVDRLKMIDEAGDKAAINAKIAKIEEDIREAHEIMNAIPENISHYAAPEIVSDLKEDLQNSISELEAKKQELQDSLTSMDKPVKADKPAKAKKATKKEEPKKKAKELSEVVYSSGDVNVILRAAKAALESGKTVTVDGRAISKVVPAAGAFFPADGSPSLRIKNYIGNISAIEIDGVPAELKPMEDKPTVPQVDKRTPEEKAKAQAAFDDRYGPNGGVQTAFGKYTGD